MPTAPPSLTFTADDFGLSEAVNEAVERAHREGVLTSASVMVAGPAAADAIRRARSLPTLKLGLHLVVIEGQAILPAAEIPALVDRDGCFPADQLRLGLRYAFDRAARAQLAREIAAQFDAFAATGLALAHADAHKHMHLHPVVGGLMIEAGRRHGLTRIRVPAEPPALMVRLGAAQSLADRALHAWTRLLRWQARRAGLAFDEQVFGIAWSGHMTAERVLALLANLPSGGSELYFHPATARDAAVSRLMPDYDHVGEFAALCDPRVRRAVEEAVLHRA